MSERTNTTSGVERAVSAAAAQGASTLVLYEGGRAEAAAKNLLPKLPEVCFVEVGDRVDRADGALRQAVEHGLRSVVFIAPAAELTKLAAGLPTTRDAVPVELLGEITEAVGGSPELADAVRAAASARDAYELWEAAGLLGPAGRELCHRVAAELEQFAEGHVAAQVVLLDPAGDRMVAMYGRLAR